MSTPRSVPKAPPAPPAPEFLRDFDYEGFARELAELTRELRANFGEEDVRHLKKIERWGKLSTALGYATAWIAPNPVSPVLFALGRNTRWNLGHHILHRGYDQVPGVPAKYTSKVFARGWRRYVDWFEWWVPEAWAHIHNHLHHSNTGEPGDADLVEATPGESRALRDAIFAWYATTWKWFYYAFYSQREYQNHLARKSSSTEVAETTPGAKGYRAEPYRLSGDDYTNLRDPRVREIYLKCLAPYFFFQFVAVPLAFSPLGPWAVASVAANVAAGEVCTNFQGYACNRTSHTGDDLYRFETPFRNKTEYVVRQIVGSTNFLGGTDFWDFLYFWNNYQIEHHVWPNATMLKYQQYRPRLRALCAKYGLPYAEESVWKRLRRLYDVSMGARKMEHLDTASIGARARKAPPAEAA